MMVIQLRTACKKALQWLRHYPAAWCLNISSALAAESGSKPGPLPAPTDGGAARMKDIHDIKPALVIGYDLQWLYWALAAVGLVILLALAWWLWRRHKCKAVPESVVAPIPAETEAYRQLDALAADDNPDPKQFYFSLSAILRRYIERRYSVQASEMTTEELLPAVDRLGLKTELALPLKDFCRGTDPIKYAAATAVREHMARDLSFARDFVRQTTPIATTGNENGGQENPLPVSQIKSPAATAAEQRRRITN